jgi:heme/copper-type cytochrome/quinol oxidase subunit 3
MGVLNTGVNTGKLGMWVFLASEIMFFTALIGTYIVLRMGSDSWPVPGDHLAVPVLAVNTFVLISSSVTMVLGVQAFDAGDKVRASRMLLYTALMGLLFLSIKLGDYVHMIHQGFTINSSLLGSVYYFLTGFHGLHVLAGVISLLIIRSGVKSGRLQASQHFRVEGVGLYWHFVDLIWIILFAILCLV